MKKAQGLLITNADLMKKYCQTLSKMRSGNLDDTIFKGIKIDSSKV